jgi:hypothetical protein
VSTPITEPGWYRLGPQGLERIAGLEDTPEETWDLVRVEFGEHMAEEPLF